MHWEVGCHNFAYFSTFVGDVLVKFRHDVFTAVYGGRGAILVELRDAMTAEPGHIVLVDNFGISRVVIVVVSGSEERLEVCHEKESDRVLLFLRYQILTCNSRGRDTGLVEVSVEDRKECEFPERTEWRKGGGSC